MQTQGEHAVSILTLALLSMTQKNHRVIVLHLA